MKSTKCSSPLSGIEFEILDVDNKTLVLDTPFKGLVSIKYDSKHDSYVIPASIFKPFKTITAKQASEMLDVSLMRISRLCSDGVLKSVKINNSLIIDETSVKEYKDVRCNSKHDK